MATTYTSKACGSFKTGLDQRAIKLKIAPKSTVTAHVGEIYKIDSSGELERVSSDGSSQTQAAAVAAAKAAVAVGQYILAQSDMTMGYGHVPVEIRDYMYKDDIVMIDSVTRDFVVYRINTLEDIIITTDDTSVTA